MKVFGVFLYLLSFYDARRPYRKTRRNISAKNAWGRSVHLLFVHSGAIHIREV